MYTRLAVLWNTFMILLSIVRVSLVQALIVSVFVVMLVILFVLYSVWTIVVFVKRSIVQGGGFLLRLLVLAIFSFTDRQMPDMRR